MNEKIFLALLPNILYKFVQFATKNYNRKFIITKCDESRKRAYIDNQPAKAG